MRVQVFGCRDTTRLRHEWHVNEARPGEESEVSWVNARRAAPVQGVRRRRFGSSPGDPGPGEFALGSG